MPSSSHVGQLDGQASAVSDLYSQAKFSTEEKREWLRDFMLNPGNNQRQLTIQNFRDKIREKFGETLGTAHLNSVVKSVRDEIAEQYRIDRGLPPTAKAILPPQFPSPGAVQSHVEPVREAPPASTFRAHAPAGSAPLSHEEIEAFAERMKVSGISRIDARSDGNCVFYTPKGQGRQPL